MPGALTCIRWSIVAADIRGLMRIRGHHLIVVLIWAVDTYLGNPVRLNAQELTPWSGSDPDPFILWPPSSPGLKGKGVASSP